ncbi:E3 ubiquitin-protein ligase TRIM8 [Varanus komodoensis]|nr:E3 ubiquitin-protein ligase TRIM8 [Varanus komodoensis]
MLVKQQDRLEEREQDIEEQLYKLESDKRLVEEKVNQLKDEVRLQYEKMHQILDEDLRKTMEILDKAQAKFCNENAAQVLHLSERMQEAKKLLSSVQVMYDKTEDINFMKNTKSVKILMDRTQNCTGGSLPPPKIGHLNSKLFLNEIAKKEKQLRKLLEELEPEADGLDFGKACRVFLLDLGPFSTPVPFLQSIPMYPCSVSNSGAEKRKHSTAFPEASFLEPSSGPVASQYVSQGASAGEGQSAQPMVPCSSTQHIVGLPSGPQPVHSGSMFNPSHYPNSTSSQQSVLSQYGGRKILVCSVDNCYCSSVSNHSGHQPYPRSGHFPWTVSSQEYSHPLPPAPSVPQSLPGLAVREWIDASQQHGRQDFYRVYGQPSTKHYVTS